MLFSNNVFNLDSLWYIPNTIAPPSLHKCLVGMRLPIYRMISGSNLSSPKGRSFLLRSYVDVYSDRANEYTTRHMVMALLKGVHPRRAKSLCHYVELAGGFHRSYLLQDMGVCEDGSSPHLSLLNLEVNHKMCELRTELLFAWSH
jgi:hypothetical protein